MTTNTSETSNTFRVRSYVAPEKRVSLKPRAARKESEMVAALKRLQPNTDHNSVFIAVGDNGKADDTLEKLAGRARNLVQQVRAKNPQLPFSFSVRQDKIEENGKELVGVFIVAVPPKNKLVSEVAA